MWPMRCEHSLPLDVQACLSRALALQQSGKLAAALAAYDNVLAEMPLHPQALHLRRRVQTAMAADHYRRANRLVQSGDADQALAGFDQALAFDPDHIDARYNACVLLFGQKAVAEALGRLDELVARAPSFARGWNLRGIALMRLCQPAAAYDCFLKAGEADPHFADAQNNLGSALRDLGQHQAALDAYRRALALRPDFAEARWNIGVALLTMGDFARGWDLYEGRKALNPAQFTPHANAWSGHEALAGRSILLGCEQGLGDSLQFCRYAQLMQQLGARVVLAVQPPLRGILARALPWVRVIGDQDRAPDCDFTCDLLSLPRALATDLATIPPPVPLTATAAQQRSWRQRLPGVDGRRIGIAWSGNPAHITDHARSTKLALWRGLIAHDANWFALQKDLRPEDADILVLFGRIRHFGDELRDFDDTAGLVAAMDLVITVDTSVAHLAASMGKPVWLLLAFTPDWRWLLDRTDSPWYPTVRLFRQHHPGDWAGVMGDVAAALRLWLSRPDAGGRKPPSGFARVRRPAH